MWTAEENGCHNAGIWDSENLCFFRSSVASQLLCEPGLLVSLSGA